MRQTIAWFSRRKEAPKAPGAPVLSNVSTSSVDVEWGPVLRASAYELEHSLVEADQWQPLYDGAGLTYSDKLLPNDTEVFYRVRAYNVRGASDWSPLSSVVTGGTGSPPDMPTAPTYTNLQPTSMRLVWAPAARATRYVLQRLP
jgi:hypothetical protein